MTDKSQPIHIAAVGELAEIQSLIEKGCEINERPLQVSWLTSLEEFEAIDLDECDLVITDSHGLGMGANAVVNAAKLDEPRRPVVLIARLEEVEAVSQAMDAGLDEFVLKTEHPAFEALLLKTLSRALERGRQDLPALLAVQMSKTQFWAFFDSAPMAMKVLDKDGVLLHVNPAMANFLAYEVTELVGQSIFEVMHPDEVDHARDVFQELISGHGGKKTHQAEYEHHIELDRRYVRDDGGLVWGNLFLLALWNTDGTLRHVIGIMVDITDRVEAMAALEAREAHERAILDTTVDGILTVDASGQIETINRACERLFGYRPHEIVGQEVGLLMPTTNHLTLEEALTGASHSSEAREVEGQHKDGTRFPLEVSVGEMEIDAERKFTIILRDVSERHQLLERLRRSERMEAVGQLAGGISHDFNNLLAIINTYAYLLKAGGRIQEPELKHIHKILAATERGARLTSQLMALSPNPLAEPEPLLLNEVATKLEELLQTVIEEDITLVTRLDPDLFAVKADLGQMEQIFMNLIINARDAMPHGGTITVQTSNVTIKPSARRRDHPIELQPGNYAVLRVSDTGQGINEGIIEHIFEPFFSTKERGTGLGLATVFSIVERHGGTIEVRSVPDHGTTFTIYLPSLDSAPVKSDQGEPVQPEPAPTLERLAMLLVEDEQDLRTSLAGVFELDGFEVLVAADAEQALEMAQAHQGPIDVLLTDIIMPGMNGVELSEVLSEMYPDMRVILVSGYAGDALLRKDISPRRTHLAKPYDIVELKSLVHTVARNSN